MVWHGAWLALCRSQVRCSYHLWHGSGKPQARPGKHGIHSSACRQAAAQCDTHGVLMLVAHLNMQQMSIFSGTSETFL